MNYVYQCWTRGNPPDNGRYQAVWSESGAFFMSLRASARAVHNLSVQAPLTLRGICNGQRMRDRYCNLCHPDVMTIS